MNYEELKEIKREYSKYPRGLKHYAKDTVAENSLFDLDLMAYKLKSIAKGQSNDERDKTGSKETGSRSAKEILRGYLFRLLHEDGNTESGSGEGRAIEDRYIGDYETEREEHKESDAGRKEKTQTQTHED